MIFFRERYILISQKIAKTPKHDYLEDTTMKIALGCDHGGYELKQFVMKTLEKLGHEYEDFGCYSTESCVSHSAGSSPSCTARIILTRPASSAGSGSWISTSGVSGG